MKTSKTEINRGEPCLRTIAMPADANPNGDIFGGWMLAQMDLAGAVIAKQTSKGRVVTIAVDAMQFHQPVFIGDLVTCYCALERVGNTSMTVKIESWVKRMVSGEEVLVTEGRYTYVAIDENRKPRLVKGA